MTTQIDPTIERAICQDYTATLDKRWRYTTQEIANRRKVSQFTVNIVRLRNGLSRNNSNAEPKTRQLRCAIAKSQNLPNPEKSKAQFACPKCGTRSLEAGGHPQCRGRAAA